MRFSIGALDFELSTKRSKLDKQLKEVYQGDIGNRVDTIRFYRNNTRNTLREAIAYCNENIFIPEHKVGS